MRDAAGVVLVALAVGLAAAGPALAADSTGPVYDKRGRIVQTPFVPAAPGASLTKEQAIAKALAYSKVADWLDRYPPNPQRDAEYKSDTRQWTVHVWSGEAGEIARVKVDDTSGRVVEALTGPQVAWSMARGGRGAFGGVTINRPLVWLAFCALFLAGLVDWRRPLRIRNLDLLALLSFSVSLWFFNKGEVFWSVPLAYPPLVWLLARMLVLGGKGREEPAGRSRWPVWALAGATIFLLGFRIGLNIEAQRSVIDVGYAGVIGAERIVAGQMPYGHMPDEGPACGPADAEGQIRDRVQPNGRCESTNARGDTYGPVSYLAYIPGYLAFGWRGKWDSLPAAHATSLLWDALAVLGLALVGRRFGGKRLAATLAFAWAAYPFTLYVSNSNTNDSIMPAILIWGFWLASSPVGRGAAVALGGWTKFAGLLLTPLWLTYPDGLKPRRAALFGIGFLAAMAASFSILLLEPDVGHAAHVFFDRTFTYQLDRQSPFSLWDWEQYHAKGIPDLHLVQRVLEVALVALTFVVAFLPRRKSPLQLAALSAALLLGFELVLTHWFYLYLPWFFPFVAIALFIPRASRRVAVAADGGTVPVELEGGVEEEEEERESEAMAWRRVDLVAVGAALALFLVTWGVLQLGFYKRDVITDIPVYESYGTRIENGDVPYVDFGVEYPPLALPMFVVPELLSHDSSGYKTAFETLMAACGLAAVLLVGVVLVGLRAPPRRLFAALLFAALAPLLLGSVVLTRYDLWPAALAVGALAAFVHGRPRLGSFVLGCAVAAKLWPVVLLPLAAAWLWRRYGRREMLIGVGLTVGVTLAAYLPFFVQDPGGVMSSVSRQLGRPLQIESLGSGVLLAVHHLFGTSLGWESSHGSQNLTGTAAGTAAVLLSILQVAVLVWLWWDFARRPAGPERLLRYSAAAVVAFIAFGKVLSPQFLIWLLPLVPLVAGRRGLLASAVLAVGCLLTQLWFPYRYWELVYDFDGFVSLLVLVRDLVLVGLVAVLVLALPRVPDP